MSGETNLNRLLASMQPRLRDATYVFATVATTAELPAGLEAVMTFREAEGVTVILEESEALHAGLAGTFRSRMITLDIHSSLEAVGFLAAITACLAEAGMGVNPVSAYYHDHLFVPADRAAEAMQVLRRLSQEAEGSS
jgi:hypothetical protein